MSYLGKMNHKHYSTTYYERHRIEAISKAKQYQRDHYQEYIRKQKEWRDSVRGRYKAYQYRAKRESRTFSITEQEFDTITQQDCHYCKAPGPNGIDRVDNYIGYESNNCLPCCLRCNYMKSDMHMKEFFQHILKIADNIREDL